MNILKYVLVILLSVMLWGCGKGNSSSVTINPTTGKHSAGWAVGSVGGTHVDKYFANPASCEGCHGKPLDMTGGISKVSCSTVSRSGISCHGGAWPHGEGFNVPLVHGTQVVNNGLALCQKCHGFDYKGIAGLGVSCIACHKLANPANNAPHAFDWTAGALRHSATNPKFAPTCGECHLGGKQLTTPVPLPPGIPTPTCIGPNALCHAAAGHAMPYIDPADHGIQAHTKGPIFCGTCHADGSAVPRFNVSKGSTNLVPNGCENCHYETLSGLAHPYGWLPGRGTTAGNANTTTHATANFGAGGAYCSPCHTITGTIPLAGSNAPSCMTQTAQIGGTTYCHFTASPVANANNCRSCHGTTTTNGRPDGTAIPNRNFRHGAHFTKMPTLTCSICHLGKGTGSTDHSTVNLSVATNSAAVVIPGVAASPSFSDMGKIAPLADASYSHATGYCTNVSCHGGNSLSTSGANYKWTSATQASLSADGDCQKCHTVSPYDPAEYTVAGVNVGPYIGPFSGFSSINANQYVAGYKNLHQFHITLNSPAAQCVSCHDKTKVHSRILLGKRVIGGAGFAASSVKLPFGTTYNVTGVTSNCSGGCHTAARSWYK